MQVPSIVPDSIYDHVRAQMDKNARLQKRNCKTEYLLRSLLLCKQCERLTARLSTPNNQYYCTGKYEAGLRDTCKCPWPNAAKLDERVWNRIVALMSDVKQLEEALRNHQLNRESERGRTDAEMVSLLRDEKELKAEENRWLDAYGRGSIDANQLQERMALVRKQRDVLDKMKAEI